MTPTVDPHPSKPTVHPGYTARPDHQWNRLRSLEFWARERENAEERIGIANAEIRQALADLA